VAIEPLPCTPVTHTIDPVVVCNPDEVQTPTALRRRYRVEPGVPFAAVVHAGVSGEIDQLRKRVRAGQATVTLDLFAEESLFPAAAWLGGADLVVSGAGYNSYWEAQWLGYGARACFVPFQRRIDDQAWRLRLGAWKPRQNGADTLAAWVSS
jgi:hypothetical protein